MNIKRLGHEAIKQEIKGLQALSTMIDSRFESAVVALDTNREVYDQRNDHTYISAGGKVICTGVGKSGHIAKKIAATMTSLGTPAVFVHPTEAAHGDLGVVSKLDSLLMLSRSGKAGELYAIAQFANDRDIPSVLISENDQGGLSSLASVTLKLPKVAEAWGHAPTTSTIMQLSLGDALSIALAEKRSFTEDDFKLSHPGGELGKR